MNYVRLFVMAVFCFLMVSCSKTQDQAEEIKTEVESMIPDTVSVDTVLNELEKNTGDLKKKTEDVKKEIDELLQ